MKRHYCALFLLVLSLLAAGCGGGSGPSARSAATGRATFSVTWPTRGRLIPLAANGIVIKILGSSSVVATQTLARPASGGVASATFNLLPVGTFTVIATAYPNADGAGVAQAEASVPLTITAGQNTPITLTMASTIDHLSISPSPAAVTVGQSVPLTVTAVDAAGAVVLITPSKLQWSAANATASVDANGSLSGLANGTTSFTVTELESGKSASVGVTVGQSIVIGGTPYDTTGSPETITATFTTADGGDTISTFKGYVLLHVTGVGQAYGTDFNDAFYLYTGFPGPTNGWDGGYYQLAFGTQTLTVGNLGQNAENFLVSSVPTYTGTHDYTFVLNTKLTVPGVLHFGVSDGGFSDNTGAYTITVTQLVPAP